MSRWEKIVALFPNEPGVKWRFRFTHAVERQEFQVLCVAEYSDYIEGKRWARRIMQEFSGGLGPPVGRDSDEDAWLREIASPNPDMSVIEAVERRWAREAKEPAKRTARRSRRRLLGG